MKINKANGQTKTEKLHALELRRDAVLGKMRDLSEPKGAAKFARLTTQIESLAGSFVTYQGREVEARKVNYISGCVPTSSEDLDGDEDLFRDDQGRYYLRRRLAHDKQERVHRISPTAAILWATTRLNSETLDLRRDAVAALKAPTPTSATRHSADGSMTITLHLPPDPARLVRQAAAANEQSELLEIWGCIQSGTIGRIARTNIDQREMDTIFEDNRPGQSLALTLGTDPVGLLDDHCRELVRAYLAERPDLDSRDVVNGAVEFLISDPEEDDEICSSAGCVSRAKARRTNDQPAPAAVASVPVPILKANGLQKDDGCQHFTFSYPPKAEVCGVRHGIKLDAEQMEQAKNLALPFGLEVSVFLKKLVGRRLPGQPDGSWRSRWEPSASNSLALIKPWPGASSGPRRLPGKAWTLSWRRRLLAPWTATRKPWSSIRRRARCSWRIETTCSPA